MTPSPQRCGWQSVRHAALGDSEFWVASSHANNGTSGTEPWRTDGTTLGTVPLKDINPSGDSYPSSFVASGQYVYFSANDGTNGSELWRTDGVPETLTNIHTTLVADINVGSNGSYPGNITSFKGGRVLFSADDGGTGSELWISDGTSLGTTRLTDINIAGGSNPSNITEWNGKAYFLANDLNYLTNVWKTDGTPAGTTQVTAFGAGYISNWNNPFVKFGGKLWFAADDGIVGTELCSIDVVIACTPSAMRGSRRPLIARLFASEPDPVKTTSSPSTPSTLAMRDRAVSTASKANRPNWVLLPGLPKPRSLSSRCRMQWMTSGRRSVVAL